MAVRGRLHNPDIFTPREWAVFQLLREGRTNEQIAEELGVTIDGAKYHVSSILSKLGVSSRVEASRWQPEAPAQLGHRPGIWSLVLAFAKISGTAVAASAILGIGVLGYGVLISKNGNEALDQRAAAAEAGDTLHEASGSPRSAAGAPDQSSATLTSTPLSPSSPGAGGQPAQLPAIPAQTAGPGQELLDDGGAIIIPGVSSSPVPTNAQKPTGDAKPTPTPTPTPLPIPMLVPTPITTPTATPTPMATPTPTPSHPAGHETEDPRESETPEPTETQEPAETPDN
jgi:DNA-binding CsgD family transcriptional regulator